MRYHYVDKAMGVLRNFYDRALDLPFYPSVHRNWNGLLWYMGRIILWLLLLCSDWRVRELPLASYADLRPFAFLFNCDSDSCCSMRPYYRVWNRLRNTTRVHQFPDRYHKASVCNVESVPRMLQKKTKKTKQIEESLAEC